MGQIGTALALREVIGKAAKTGIVAGAIRGSNHCGTMVYFARMALPHDTIGIATTNALPTMAPWGGAERILGINPIAMSVPAGKMDPIVYAAAFSGSSLSFFLSGAPTKSPDDTVIPKNRERTPFGVIRNIDQNR